MILLTFIKNYSAKFYYKILKYVYNYKTGDILKSFNYETAKTTILKILYEKKWSELMTTSTHRAMIVLYQLNEENTNFIKNLIQTFELKLARFFCIWTLASFINQIYLIPLISFFWVIYRKKDKIDYYKIIFIILSVIAAYFYNNYLVISFISEFASSLLLNGGVLSLFRMLFKKTKKKLKIVWQRNENNLDHFAIFTYIVLLNQLVIPSDKKLLSIQYLLFLISNHNYVSNILLLILLTTGYISDFNVFHLILNSLILYFARDILKGQNLKSIFRIFIVMIKDLIELSKEKVFNMSNMDYTTMLTEYKLIDFDPFASTIENKKVIQLNNHIFSLPTEEFLNEISAYPIENSSGEFNIQSYKICKKVEIIKNYM